MYLQVILDEYILYYIYKIGKYSNLIIIKLLLPIEYQPKMNKNEKEINIYKIFFFISNIS